MAFLTYIKNLLTNAIKQMEPELIDDKTQKIIDRNKHWQKQLNWNYGDLMKAFNVSHQINVESAEFVKLVKQFQARKGLSEDGILGPGTYSIIVESLLTPKDLAVMKAISHTISHESGGSYSSMNLDGEFRGRFDKVWLERHGTKHPASGKIHIGLSFGIIQFTQDGGSLGLLLRESAKRNPDKFKRIFGSSWDVLLDVLTSPGQSGLASRRLRGPRVREIPVRIGDTMAAKDIWEKPWTDAFKRFGEDPEFQAVQRELAVREYLVPILPRLKELGLVSEKAVAAAFDGSVHRGVGGFRTLLNRIAKGKNTTPEILEALAKVNNRFANIINNNSLSHGEWAGWEHFNV